MRALAFALLILAALSSAVARATEQAKRELAPTGKLRVGVAVGPTPGAGNVARDEATGSYRVDLGGEPAQKLAVPAEFVPYPNSGALTEAAAADAWDVGFIPVDAERKAKADFGSAHIVLQSTCLVGPDSSVRTMEDVDKPGVRVFGVEAPPRRVQRHAR